MGCCSWGLRRALAEHKQRSITPFRERLLSLIEPAETVMDVNIGAALWIGARGVGVPLTVGPNQLDGDSPSSSSPVR